MIRKFQKTDLDSVANLWLTTNIAAHSFIPPQYWQDQFEAVKKMLPQAELYVYEEAGKVQAFIGLYDNYVAGIFVCRESWSRGIGKQLLDYCKSIKTELRLNVYQKNVRAVRFYEREHFKIMQEDVDSDTGEAEYVMQWRLR